MIYPFQFVSTVTFVYEWNFLSHKKENEEDLILKLDALSL